jgi:hypothetical protein
MRIHLQSTLTFWRHYMLATSAVLFIKAYVEMYAGKLQKKKVNCKSKVVVVRY